MIMFENALRLFFYPNKGKEFQMEPPLGGEWNGIEKRVLAGFVGQREPSWLRWRNLTFPAASCYQIEFFRCWGLLDSASGIVAQL